MSSVRSSESGCETAIPLLRPGEGPSGPSPLRFVCPILVEDGACAIRSGADPRYGQLLSCVVVRTPFRARPDGVRAPRGEAVSRAMSLTATARSIPGTLRQEVVIDGRHRLITDEPQRLGGDGSGPAPHELFPAALAACVSTTLVMYARTKGWELGEVAVEVDYDHRSTPRRFQIAIRLGGDLSDAQLERLDRVARACPLRRSIEAGIEFVETLERREGSTVYEPVEIGGA